MFDRLNPSVERLDRIAISHLDWLLGDYRSMVHLLVDEVNRHACHPNTVIQRCLDCTGAGKSRQERRMDVQDSIGKAIDE